MNPDLINYRHGDDDKISLSDLSRIGRGLDLVARRFIQFIHFFLVAPVPDCPNMFGKILR